jgi:dCTP deaminase
MPGTRFLVSTRERVELAGDLAGTLWLRTTWARRGVLASFGMVDAGFHGTLTLAALNGSHKHLEVSVGETFAQLVFESLDTAAAKTYEERSGNYQDQEGVTPSRSSP